ncbi:hypothetical protein AABB24_003152, partial [Solanum stoloniferum]
QISFLLCFALIMKAAKFNVFTQFRFLFFNSKTLNPLNPNTFRFLTVAAVLPSPEKSPEDQTEEELSSTPKDSADLFKQWGCTDDDISKIFQRRPSLQRMELKLLDSKLKILSELGLPSSDLTRIINCRPRFLDCRINRCLEERLEFFQTLFGTKEILLKAIVRNPSLLTYDFHKQIKPIVAFYEQLGLSRSELVSMLLARPTLIPRTSLDDEKMDFIRRTGVEKGTTMYKHVVALFAISRSETIRQKVANLEKHGFSEDEVFRLFGRSPFLLTLSVDKVQRNMTYILGTMKLSANLVQDNPCLLFLNLETAIKPRYLLGAKLDDMGLVPRVKGPSLLRAMRMTEKRFIKAFINCHPEDVAHELMEYYTGVKRVRRLAESSKKQLYRGFPF